MQRAGGCPVLTSERHRGIDRAGMALRHPDANLHAATRSDQLIRVTENAFTVCPDPTWEYLLQRFSHRGRFGITNFHSAPLNLT
jgi:hypothetical protein